MKELIFTMITIYPLVAILAMLTIYSLDAALEQSNGLSLNVDDYS